MKHLVELICPTCGKRFRRPAAVFRAQVKKGQKNWYCSWECAGEGAGKRRGWITRRQQVAFNLREQGLTFREVGERLGVTRARAHQLYKKAVEGKRASQRFGEKVDEAHNRSADLRQESSD